MSKPNDTSSSLKIKTAVITLGETDYKIAALPFTRSKAWRTKLIDELKPMIEKAGVMWGNDGGMEFSDPSDLLSIIPLLHTALIDSMDTIFDLIVTYSDTLENAKEEIESTATEQQLVWALRAMLDITDPFGMGRLIDDLIGRWSRQTSSSLRSVNGASRSKKRPRSRKT